MDRRHYLALVGSGLVLSIAGCAGNDGANTGDNGENDSNNDNNGSDDGNNSNANGSENGNDTEEKGGRGEENNETNLEKIAFGETQNLTIKSGDSEDPVYNDLAKPVLFEASAGDEVTITHSSNAFDAYLVLEGPNGSIIAENDDGDGISLNSRISTTLTERGTHTIWAGSYSGNTTGPFTLSLEEGLYSGDSTG